MATYRCPKHDKIFDTITDARMPGAPARGNLAEHPHNGHPDCPDCEAEAGSPLSRREEHPVQVQQTTDFNKSGGALPPGWLIQGDRLVPPRSNV